VPFDSSIGLLRRRTDRPCCGDLSWSVTQPVAVLDAGTEKLLGASRQGHNPPPVSVELRCCETGRTMQPGVRVVKYIFRQF